ncbi:TRAP transporter substrate-binding protein [Savagea faecisuis]|uniref:TRAP transporter substrate-binding protein n=1 Tax=Savagea faecisuis TaxID=1274803 RepID=A0ABW3GXE1_9BACL
MRKWFIFLGALALLALVGCSPDSKGNEKENKEDTFKLTYNVAFPPGDDNDAVSISTEHFAKEVKERTNGRVEIDVYFSSQLTPVDQIVEGLKSGTIDMAYTLPEYYGESLPTGFYGSLPFLGQDIDQFISLLRDDGIADIMHDEFLQQGAKILFYATPGEYGFLSNKPIRSVADMKGLSIRAGNSLWTPWYQSMQVAPANIPTTDIYQALQLGTIDGLPYSLNTIEYYNYHEVVKSITTGLRVSALSSSMISEKTWNKLPEELQKIILEVAAETELKNIEFYKSTEGQPQKFAAEHNVEVNELTGEAYEEFVESGQIVWDGFADLNDNTAKIADILKERLTQ